MFVFIALDYTAAQLDVSEWNKLKHKIWTVLDKPTSSFVARVSVNISVFTVYLGNKTVVHFSSHRDAFCCTTGRGKCRYN